MSKKETQKPIRKWRRPAKIAGATTAALTIPLLALAFIIMLIDSEVGHRWVIHKLEKEVEGLTISGMRGSLYNDFQLLDTTVADQDGPYIHIPQTRISWNPWALFTKRINIQHIHVEKLTLIRFPQHNTPQTTRRQKGAFLPALPFDIQLEALEIERITARINDIPTELTLNAKGQLYRVGDIDLNLKLLPLSQNVRDYITVDLGYSSGLEKLQLNADIAAARDGILAQLSGVAQGFTFAAKGQGPFADWQAEAQLELDGRTALEISAHHSIDKWSLRFDAQSAALLPKDLLKWVGPGLTGSAVLQPRPHEVGVTFLVASKKARLGFSGTIVLKPELTFGSGSTLTMDLADPDTIPLRAAHMTSHLAGRLRSPQADIDITFEVAKTAQPALATLFKDGGRLQTRVNFDSGFAQRVNLSQIKISSSGFITTGALFHDPRTQAVEGAFKATFQRIERWLPKEYMSGDLTADIVLKRHENSSAPGFDISLSGTNLDSSLPPLKALLSLSPKLDTQITLDGNTVIFSETALYAQGVQLSAQGRYEDGNVSGELVLDIAQSSLFNTALNGPAHMAVKASGPPRNLALKAGLTVGEAVLARTRLSALKFDLMGNIATGVDLQIEAFTRGEKLQGASRFRYDDLFIIETLKLEYLGWNGHGEARQNRNGTVVGSFTLEKAENARALFGLDGKVALNAEFLDQDAVQLIDFTLDANQLRLALAKDIFRSDLLKAQGRVRLTETGPGLWLSAKANSVEFNDIFLPILRLEANRDGISTKADITFTSLAPIPSSFNIGAVATPDKPTADKQGKWSLIADINGEIDGVTVSNARPLSITLSPTTQYMEAALFFVHDGQIELDFTREPAALTSQFSFKDIPSELLRAFGANLRDTGHIEGHGVIRNTETEQTAQVTLSLTGLSPKTVDTSMMFNGATQLLVTDAHAELKGHFTGDQDATLDFNLQFQTIWKTPNGFPALETAKPWAGQLDVTSPLAPVWALNAQSEHDVEGILTADLILSGTADTPILEGRANISQGRYENHDIGLTFTDLNAAFRLDNQQIYLDNISAQDGSGGKFQGQGKVYFDKALGFPGNINLTTQDFWAVRRDDLRVKTDSDINIQSGPAGLAISGKLSLIRTEITLRDSETASIPTIDYVEINTPLDLNRDFKKTEPSRPISINLDVQADRRVFVEGLGLNSEWSADLKITGRTQSPSLQGQANLVRGELDFAGKRFDLQRGVLNFLSARKIDPQLDILAENIQDDLTARIAVQGTASKPQLSFSSTPGYPEDEILSRILFGASVADLGPLEAVQLASALTSLSGRGGGLNVLGTARRGLGIDRLSLGTPTSQTAITGGKYLTDDVYLEITSDPKSGQTAASVEWSITRRLSLISRLSAERDTNMSVRWSRDY